MKRLSGTFLPFFVFFLPVFAISSPAQVKPNNILYGVSYYHEYMPAERLEKDVQLMQEAGITVVRVLARGKDFQTIVDSDTYYYPAYGKLVPSTVSQADLLSGRYPYPLKDITYAIFKIGMKKTKPDPTFNYS